MEIIFEIHTKVRSRNKLEELRQFTPRKGPDHRQEGAAFRETRPIPGTKESVNLDQGSMFDIFSNRDKNIFLAYF